MLLFQGCVTLKPTIPGPGLRGSASFPWLPGLNSTRHKPFQWVWPRNNSPWNRSRRLDFSRTKRKVDKVATLEEGLVVLWICMYCCCCFVCLLSFMAIHTTGIFVPMSLWVFKQTNHPNVGIYSNNYICLHFFCLLVGYLYKHSSTHVFR